MTDEGPLDASLGDFEHPPESPTSLRHYSEPATTDPDSDRDGNLRELEDSDTGSAGGYSPPAWRRLGNGDRSSGFWRGPRDVLGTMPLHAQSPFAILQDPMLMAKLHEERTCSRGASPESGEHSNDDVLLEKAIQTQLPRGSQSPGKGRSPSPKPEDDPTIRLRDVAPAENERLEETTPADNCKKRFLFFAS